MASFRGDGACARANRRQTCPYVRSKGGFLFMGPDGWLLVVLRLYLYLGVTLLHVALRHKRTRKKGRRVVLLPPKPALSRFWGPSVQSREYGGSTCTYMAVRTKHRPKTKSTRKNDRGPVQVWWERMRREDKEVGKRTLERERGDGMVDLEDFFWGAG